MIRDDPTPPAASTPLPDLLRVHSSAEPLGKVLRGLAIASIWFALGVVGWLVPVMTGIPFYIAGLVALALISRRVRRWINRWDRGLSTRARLRIRRMMHKLPGHGLQRMLEPYRDPEK